MTQTATITVDGSYSPAVTTLTKGQPATVTFLRTSDRGCLQAVQSADLNFQADLPLSQPVTFTIATDQPGTYTYSCGMDMAHGTIVIA